MRKFFLFIAAVTYGIAAPAQIDNAKPQQPDEEIIVKKEYDEHGNLLRYDSVYTYKWFSDSTFSFPEFGGWNNLFKNDRPFPELFPDGGFSDSILKQMPFFRDFPHSFFDEDGEVMPFSHEFGIPDTSFFRNFSFQIDTTFFMGPDSSFLLPPGFIMPDMKSLRELFRDQDSFRDGEDPFSRFFFNGPDSRFGQFFDEDQQKEWQNLMEKHRQEMDDFYRKWQKHKDPGNP